MVNKDNIPLQRLIKALSEDKGVVIQTDTVIGLLSLKEEIIREIKRRFDPEKKTVKFIGSIEDIEGEIPLDLKGLLEEYWPGPLTIVYKQQGYRIPNTPVILEALKALKRPIYASSANISTKPVAKSIKEAKETFKDSTIEIEYIDLETDIKDIASTVYCYDTKEILREGVIKKEDIERFIKEQRKS